MAKLLFEFQVADSTVKVFKRDFPVPTSFGGQKIHHPFEMVEKGKGKVYADELTDPNFWNIVDEFQIKFDGSMSALVWNHSKQKYELYVRLDMHVNNGKLKNNMVETLSEDGQTMIKMPFEEISKTWIQCEECPDASLPSAHWPHLRPASQNPAQYKHYINAFNASSDEISKFNPKEHGKLITIECVGKPLNQKFADPLKYYCGIVVHGSLVVEIPKELQNFDGMKKVLLMLPTEGLVAYCNDGKVFKIRSDLFEIQWEKMDPSMIQYGQSEIGLSNQVVLNQPNPTVDPKKK